MKVYVTSVGSGHTLNYPHNRGYHGVLALGVVSSNFGHTYKGKDQRELYDLQLGNVKYEFKRLLEVDESKSFYETGKEILDVMDGLIEKEPKVKFHIEISAGYKFVGHILTFIAYLRYSHVDKLTFLRYDENREYNSTNLPIILINLNKKERKVFEGYVEAWREQRNSRISQNGFVMKYEKNKSYLYRVFNKCKRCGFLDDSNQLTDFGRLYLEFGHGQI